MANRKSPPRAGRVEQEVEARAVTVKVLANHRTTRGVPLKSARHRMTSFLPTNSRVVPSSRRAVRTTHKTVKNEPSNDSKPDKQATVLLLVLNVNTITR